MIYSVNDVFNKKNQKLLIVIIVNKIIIKIVLVKKIKKWEKKNVSNVLIKYL